MLRADPGHRPRLGTVRRLALLALIVLLALLVLAPARAHAQTAWESPRLLSPEPIGGFGLYYVRFAALPGDGVGGFVTWRPVGFPAGVSLRAGAAEGAGGTTAGFGGVDVSAPLARRTEARPIDLSWNTGAGLAVGEYLLVTVPIGIAAGRSWTSGSVWLNPYVAARASMDLRLGGEGPEDEFDVSPGLDVGLDAAFDQGRNVVLRFSTSLGDRSALALGVVLGG
jgi:hypothetical protein